MFQYPYVNSLSDDIIEEIYEDTKNELENKIDYLQEKYRRFREEDELEIALEYQRKLDFHNKGLSIMINMHDIKDDEFNFQDFDRLIKLSQKFEKPLGVYITGSSFGARNGDVNPINYVENSIPMLFTQKALDNIVKLNNHLVESGESGVFFLEEPDEFPDYSWSLEQVIHANDSIDVIVNDIKNLHFTPFEAMMYIHQYVSSQFVYNGDITNTYQSRSIVGVLNSNKIVCVGYARLIKAIVEKVNMPGLKCSGLISIMVSTGENAIDQSISDGCGHMQDIITIDDPTYGINGTYINDACWDSPVFEFPQGRGIGNFMYPIEDLKHLEGTIFYQPDDIDTFNFALDTPEKISKKDMNNYRVFRNNKDNSKPIHLKQYRDCLTNMYKKSLPHLTDSRIKYIVDQIMLISEKNAHEIFSDKATGKIAKKSHRMFDENEKIEPSK